MPETRIPTQKRSIEKRNRIIQKGFDLMCNEGFYNVSTIDIAKFAGVSTGIIYQYFNDKKEIFIEGVKNYADAIIYPMLNIINEENIDAKNINKLVTTIIDKFIEAHTISKKSHQELMAMAKLDDDIAEIFEESEYNMTKKVVDFLKENKILIEHPEEKVHIAYGLIDNLCHEIIYHKHKQVDYNIMKTQIIDIIVNILK